MSKFYVGQRVKVKCSISRHDGAVTRIVAPGGPWRDRDRMFYGWEVECKHSNPSMGLAAFEEHELIPLEQPPDWNAIASQQTIPADAVSQDAIHA